MNEFSTVFVWLKKNVATGASFTTRQIASLVGISVGEGHTIIKGINDDLCKMYPIYWQKSKRRHIFLNVFRNIKQRLLQTFSPVRKHGLFLKIKSLVTKFAKEPSIAK